MKALARYRRDKVFIAVLTWEICPLILALVSNLSPLPEMLFQFLRWQSILLPATVLTYFYPMFPIPKSMQARLDDYN